MVQTMNRTSALHRRLRWFWRTLAIAIGVIALWQTALAQPSGYREWRNTSEREERQPKWIGSDPFPIGIFLYHYNSNRPVSEIWTYLDAINADYVLYSVEKHIDNNLGGNRWTRYQDLLEGAPSGKQVVPQVAYGNSYLVQGRKSREVTFYPFDSSQLGGLAALGNIFSMYSYDENLFTEYEYDTTQFNLEYFDYRDNSAPREAVYEPSSGNRTVASGIAFRYKDSQTERWDQLYNSTTEVWESVANPINSSRLFEGVNFNNWEGFRKPYFIAVTGHLFDSGAANNSDTLLKINVYYEVDKGKTYYDSNALLRTADTNLRFLYKTVGVTKGELYPTDPTEPNNWNKYREVIKAINFEQEGMGGPTKEGATANSFDLEVIYLGREKLALHSVALRDSIVNLLLTETQEADDYRDLIIGEIDDLVRDPATNALRTEIHNLRILDEPNPLQSTAFKQMKWLIEANYNNFPNGDTLTTYNGWSIPHLPWLGEADWVTNGTYLGNAFWNMGALYNFRRDSCNTTVLYGHDLPSVKQHNGGQWGIPLFFDFDSLSNPAYAATMQERIDTMELLWQHGKLGAATPGQDLEDKFHLWRIRGLYESRKFAQQIGRPYMEYAGIQSWFHIWCLPTDSTYLRTDTTIQDGNTILTDVYGDYLMDCDTILDHRHERAEVRTLLRLPLIYGARGLTLYTFEAAPWVKYALDGESLVSLWGEEGTGFKGARELGFGGWPISDTAHNILDFYLFHPYVYTPNGDQTVTYDTLGVIPGLYLGFRDYKKEIGQSLGWLKRVGPLLQRLKWRDAYSIHFQADLPEQTHDDKLSKRALPSDEILTSVRTWHPVTGEIDSAWATYVEVGLYETIIGTNGGQRNRLLDTNYIAVLNRRVFSTENYDRVDIGYSSSVEALLDTLSESRVIALKLHGLVNPDTSNQYNRFVRVREVEPDTALLPLVGKRVPLDTVFSTNSRGEATIFLTLGPGRAALLEITYAQPDESMVKGVLQRNGQRKILYNAADQRYFSCYHRYDSSEGGWHVYFRRSLPVNATGTIQVGAD